MPLKYILSAGDCPYSQVFSNQLGECWHNSILIIMIFGYDSSDDFSKLVKQSNYNNYLMNNHKNRNNFNYNLFHNNIITKFTISKIRQKLYKDV